MTMLPQTLYTPQEYLALERASDERSELVNGQIYAMTGASFRHNLIVSNLVIGIGTQLRGGPCSVFANDLRVKVAETGMYTYPDVVGLCDRPELEDEHLDTLLNPSVIIEVLSGTTERYDRAEKFAHYRIESLREYILVAQNQVRVERYVRHGDHWLLSEISDPEGVLRIDGLGCDISLRDIYDRVEIRT